jgi:hypothetical protein
MATLMTPARAAGFGMSSIAIEKTMPCRLILLALFRRFDMQST